MARFSAMVAALGAATALRTPPETSIWPLPQQMSLGSSVVSLSPGFSIQCSALCPDPLPDAINRYASIIFFGGSSGPASGAVLNNLVLKVGADAPLNLGMNENYTLAISASGGSATVTAPTQWGALRAIESFSQLVQWASVGSQNTYTIPVAPVTITDFPRFQWRGILIDSSRHYLTVASILTVLDAMSYNKLNRLHW
jgi:hexosaminidase